MEAPESFDQYLKQKKINPAEFKSSEAEKYRSLAHDFEEMHASSFTAQYLFLINPLRRKYLLTDENIVASEKPKAVARPKMKPKI
ncbi:MAG: hypothetical protein JXQ96_06505 [Cyclobacteriaceae bacterium]